MGLSPLAETASPHKLQKRNTSFLNIFLIWFWQKRATLPFSPPQQKCQVSMCVCVWEQWIDYWLIVTKLMLPCYFCLRKKKKTYHWRPEILSMLKMSFFKQYVPFLWGIGCSKKWKIAHFLFVELKKFELTTCRAGQHERMDSCLITVWHSERALLQFWRRKSWKIGPMFILYSYCP